MRVAFITSHQIGRSPVSGNPTAAGASARLRAILPASAMIEHGTEASIISLYTPRVDGYSTLMDLFDLYVVSKVFNRHSLDIVEELVRSRKNVIFDFCDNYFEQSDLNEYSSEYRRMLELAEFCIVNTHAMGSLLRRIKPSLIVAVVQDCFESRPLPIRNIPQDGLVRCLAFGNRLVCKHLTPWLERLSQSNLRRSLAVEVLTQVDAEILTWIQRTRQQMQNNVTVSITNWTEYQLENSFLRSDLVLIPSEHGTFYSTKSLNRLLESVVSGLPVIAYPVPSYMEFRQEILLTEEPEQALEELLLNPERARAKASRAQDLILSRYNTRKIGFKWHKVLNVALEHFRRFGKWEYQTVSVRNGLYMNLGRSSLELINGLVDFSIWKGLQRYCVSRFLALNLASTNLGNQFVSLLNRIEITGANEWLLRRPAYHDFTTEQRFHEVGEGQALEIAVNKLISEEVLTSSEISDFLTSKFTESELIQLSGPSDQIIELIFELSLVISTIFQSNGLSQGLDNFYIRFIHRFICYRLNCLIVTTIDIHQITWLPLVHQK
jgi:hypothetical protein